MLLAVVIGSGIMGEQLAGVAAAHLMFGQPVFFASAPVRTGVAQWWSECIAPFGLLAVIISGSRSQPATAPFAVALYITATYWLTSSTSFANPAVTLARSAIHPAWKVPSMCTNAWD
jgi:hypothetical protein